MDPDPHYKKVVMDINRSTTSKAPKLFGQTRQLSARQIARRLEGIEWLSWGSILAIIFYLLVENKGRDLLSDLLTTAFYMAWSLLIIGFATLAFVGFAHVWKQMLIHFLRSATLIGSVLLSLVVIIFIWVVVSNLITLLST